MVELQQTANTDEESSDTIDVVIVGAGFAGLLMLHQLREKGYSARIFEAGAGIGGTWYWNRYPGARCDVESMQYSYSFSDEIQRQWQWPERYASQPEVLRYLNHVADKFDLHRDIQLQTRVTTAIFDETLSCWTIRTNRGNRLSAKFCIMATGCLSIPKTSDIKGLNCFKGNCYSTSQWPHENVSFAGRRVAVIGTGASGIQCIPIIAEQAAHVYIFQRTPNFSVPLNNELLDKDYEEEWKSNYAQRRRDMRQTCSGFWVGDINNCSSLSVMPDELLQKYETAWQKGGLTFLLQFDDLLTNKDANEAVSDFFCAKIRAIVKDPIVAEALLPYNHPFGTKRLCCDNGYYKTFNRDNVTLVDLRNECIDEITPTGIQIKNKSYEVDDIVLAIGFDAITGALLNIDIAGRSGKMLRDKWAEGPRTYLGTMIAGFPNLFTITGPGSPSELSNMATTIEEHVKWITECLVYLRMHNYNSIEPTVEAEDAWFKHVNEVANSTLYPTVNSWYTGANISGKPRMFMPYIGGCDTYWKKCEQVAMNAYEGFSFTKCPIASFATIK